MSTTTLPTPLGIFPFLSLENDRGDVSAEFTARWCNHIIGELTFAPLKVSNFQMLN